MKQSEDPKAPKPGSFSPNEWAQAGKSLACCTGLACVALAFYDSDDLVGQLLRTWVGLFGLVLTIFSLRAARD